MTEAATTSGTKSPEATTPEARKRKRNESENRTVMLRTKDNKLVEMKKEAAELSEVLHRQIEEGFVGDAIPVDVKEKTLIRVRVYCDAHSLLASWPSEVVKQRMKQNFDDEFSQTLDFAKRFFMFQAAISLKIKGLVDLLGETLAAKTSGKPIDELLSMIKEDNELTPEEEEQVLRDLDRIVL
ncbi:uncharacterized protein A4U43_C04F21330 [Asparagus officinalis]|uniref:SKP1 component dimerisation domain-containing protein n=1 Tax=Asparagus officinalis TaxID=4686 RepID=A0A5P1F4G7_ASPOF|nr:SKP1-like protein 14 isoform X2 [Asparagus officinalis]ONK72623.1 uncharacterized protein A4U43_C04F21330 [Asparagus officinalis]